MSKQQFVIGRAIILIGTLKPSRTLSNTSVLCELLAEQLLPFSIPCELVRLADYRILPGTQTTLSTPDDWPKLLKKILASDVIIFATPIWWGGRSSLMQRIIERMDALDEEYLASGRSALLNKVAGIVITGTEDGAQATLSGIMEVLTFMNFTLPPQCCAYWVGEVGADTKTERERRLANKATAHMAMTLMSIRACNFVRSTRGSSIAPKCSRISVRGESVMAILFALVGDSLYLLTLCIVPI